jgi:hypothetical protein
MIPAPILGWEPREHGAILVHLHRDLSSHCAFAQTFQKLGGFSAADDEGKQGKRP